MPARRASVPRHRRAALAWPCSSAHRHLPVTLPFATRPPAGCPLPWFCWPRRHPRPSATSAWRCPCASSSPERSQCRRCASGQPPRAAARTRLSRRVLRRGGTQPCIACRAKPVHSSAVPARLQAYSRSAWKFAPAGWWLGRDDSALLHPRRPFPPFPPWQVNSLGKWKTALQMVAMSLLLVLRNADHLLGSEPLGEGPGGLQAASCELPRRRARPWPWHAAAVCGRRGRARRRPAAQRGRGHGLRRGMS